MPTGIDDVIDHHLRTITRSEIEAIADRLYGRAVSVLTTTGPKERSDLILASRCLRRLLAAYERGTGRQLSAILIAGDC